MNEVYRRKPVPPDWPVPDGLVARQIVAGSSVLWAPECVGTTAANELFVAGLAGFDSESGAGIVQAVTEAGMQGKVAVTAMEQTPEFFKTLQDGSTTAIMVNMPGETSSVVTCLDGYQMARQGRAGAALTVAALGSRSSRSVTSITAASRT